MGFLWAIFALEETHLIEIAVNTRLLQHNKLEGIGRFMFETLKRITLGHPEHHFYFIFPAFSFSSQPCATIPSNTYVNLFSSLGKFSFLNPGS